MDRILDYFTLKTTINELEKLEKYILVDKLQKIIENSEISKPEKHNKIDDIETSKLRINLTKNEILEITDLFSDLEVSSLNENYEATHLTNLYAKILDNWNELIIRH